VANQEDGRTSGLLAEGQDVVDPVREYGLGHWCLLFLGGWFHRAGLPPASRLLLHRFLSIRWLRLGGGGQLVKCGPDCFIPDVKLAPSEFGPEGCNASLRGLVSYQSHSREHVSVVWSGEVVPLQQQALD